MPWKAIDHTGKRIGRLLVLSRAENRGRFAMWNCLCHCGKKTVVYALALAKGSTTSCGCYQKEVVTRHNQTRTKEYISWAGMKQRCLNPDNTAFSNYGGRGISICTEWVNSFQAFYHDVGPAPSDSHSIDRIDNSGNYEPGNVRWATAYEQVHNRRPRKRGNRCGKGHANWYTYPSGRRQCRDCGAASARKYRRLAKQSLLH